jgi:serine/threonine protein kinase
MALPVLRTKYARDSRGESSVRRWARGRVAKKPFSSLTALGMLPETLPEQNVVKDAVGTSADMPARPARTIAGRYLLDQRLAKGGMSTLWTAIDKRLGRDVIVKFLRLDLEGDDLRARFESEARIAASLRSPHIVEVYDVGVEGGLPFMVLERMHGEDLADRLEREGKLSMSQCAFVARQAAKGLQVAHRAGVIHRDVKPANLFLAKNFEEGAETLKILDFGVAKLTLSTTGLQTRPGVMVGSVTTMSPEQVLRSGKIDSRTDIFALSCVLYRCAVGRSPFRGKDFAGTMKLIALGEFDPPSAVERELPRGLDAFFERGLAIDPDARFNSALELASAFEAAVGEPNRSSSPDLAG